MSELKSFEQIREHIEKRLRGIARDTHRRAMHSLLEWIEELSEQIKRKQG